MFENEKKPFLNSDYAPATTSFGLRLITHHVYSLLYLTHAVVWDEESEGEEPVLMEYVATHNYKGQFGGQV